MVCNIVRFSFLIFLRIIAQPKWLVNFSGQKNLLNLLGIFGYFVSLIGKLVFIVPPYVILSIA